ncbi:MAG: hypothetical protein SCALA702_05080 [Melioribacteraceae bacterium]|nr:MAG: hypothetical protein SCALA702_05080 [Melioribacteraceae bacterium]
MSSNTDKALLTFAGLLLGGAIGSLAALMLAPMKGELLRKEIAEEADGYIEQLKKQYKKEMKKTRSVTEELVDKAEKILELSRKISGTTDEKTLLEITGEIEVLKNSIDEVNLGFQKN